MSFLCAAFDILLALGCFGLAGMLIWQWWLMHSLETTEIADLKGKLSEIKGQVSPLSDLLVSPWSGTSCVYYTLYLVEQIGSGDNPTERILIDETKMTVAVVADDTGACEVNFAEAEMVLNVDVNLHSPKVNGDQLEALLRARKLPAERVTARRFQLTETVIPEGDHLYIIGDVQLRDGAFPLIEGSTRWFMVTDDNEEETKSTQLAGAAILGFVGLSILAFGAWLGWF